MNACVSCKSGKRKCNKVRPTCANCSRLGKTCLYSEDAIQTNFSSNGQGYQPILAKPKDTDQGNAIELPGLRNEQLIVGLDPFSSETHRKHVIASTVRTQAIRIIGSFDSIPAVAAAFFVGIHQRIPALAKARFYTSLSLSSNEPQADIILLCICMYIIQQLPSPTTKTMQSSDYVAVRSLVSLLEGTSEFSLDLVHCRLLLTLYELGHGLHTAAYVSVAASARMARALGFHRKPWRYMGIETDRLDMEEKKRTWWEIVNQDRFINLCIGDARFATDDPDSLDPLPIEDLLWSESTVPGDLASLISIAPVLSTPANITVGQLARECQVLHLAGRAIRHVFEPTSDPDFNTEEALQLERTLKAFLPLLAEEELNMGKYCGSLGICNSVLFLLYENTLRHNNENGTNRNQILRLMEETSGRAMTFAEASCQDQENYDIELLSPFLSLPIFQAAIVQYRLWRQTQDPMYKQGIESLVVILADLRKRWLVADHYLEVLRNLHEDWPPVMAPSQGFH